MIWQQLTLHLPASRVDEISDLLTDAGALAVSLESDKEEEIFEPPPGDTPLWQHTKIIALFEHTADLPQVMGFLEMAVHPKISLKYDINTIEEQDWQQLCEKDFRPLCFNGKLWICPSWHEVPDKTKPHVMLDPGLAFGTGSHPTTALCLTWLAEHIKEGDTVIDYGCGSGILGIAAIKLGAQKVWAIDNDPQALEATRENALKNNISTATLEAIFPSELPLIQCDMLVANILANPLIELAPHFANLVKFEGKIALSGILDHQAHLLYTAYSPWFSLNTPAQQEEWIRLDGKRMI